MDLKLDPNDLTLGDLEDFENYVGKPIDDVIKPVPVLDEDGNRVFDDKGRPEMTMKVPAKAIICLVWLVNRKGNPDYTVAEARNVKVGSLVLTEPTGADQGNV